MTEEQRNELDNQVNAILNKMGLPHFMTREDWLKNPVSRVMLCFDDNYDLLDMTQDSHGNVTNFAEEGGYYTVATVLSHDYVYPVVVDSDGTIVRYSYCVDIKPDSNPKGNK